MEINRGDRGFLRAVAIHDDIRRERGYFVSLLKQNGIAPYGLPSRDRNPKS
jgi:hypothetical protein